MKRNLEEDGRKKLEPYMYISCGTKLIGKTRGSVQILK